MVKSALAWIKDLGWLLFTRFRANVVRWDGPDWSIVFIHDGCAHSKEELRHLLFPDLPTESDQGWMFLWQVPGTIRRSMEQGCCVVCDLNRLLRWGARSRCRLRVPPWLRANLDVAGPLKTILKRMSRTRRQSLAKLPSRGYSYEVSHRPEDLEMFYREMYVPYVTLRHQDRAIVSSMEGKRAIFEKGGLIMVKVHGQSVAAGLWQVVGDTLIFATYGIHQDHTELVKQGLAAATYWSVIDYARCNSLRCVDFGMTRPRLTDGAFGHKRQWGMRFERDILTHTMWTFIGDGLPPKLVDYLNELAFVAESDGECRCAVFSGGSTPALPAEELAWREEVAIKAGMGGPLVMG